MSIVAITGGSGFIGTALCKSLRQKGHELRILSRGNEKQEEGIRYCHWDPERGVIDPNDLKDVDVVVNLAGAGIADKRWTPKYKEILYNSRLQATELIVANLKMAAPNCRKFISASAVGYYGADKGKPFEESDPASADFLGNLCRDWEAAAQKASEFCTLQIFRFGIVLDSSGGALQQMIAPLRFGLMPIPGSGAQVISWIHLKDLIAALVRSVEDLSLQGTFNLVAPEPVSQERLLRTYAMATEQKTFAVHVPKALLQIVLGPSADMVLTSTTVSSKKLQQSGFYFSYPSIEAAMAEISRK